MWHHAILESYVILFRSFSCAGLGITAHLRARETKSGEIQDSWATRLLSVELEVAPGICLIFLSSTFQKYRKIMIKSPTLKQPIVSLVDWSFCNRNPLIQLPKIYGTDCEHRVQAEGK